MKLCVDCIYHKQHDFGDFCCRTNKLSAVTGEPIERCSIERLLGRMAAWVDDSCGKSGRFWEAKA